MWRPSGYIYMPEGCSAGTTACVSVTGYTWTGLVIMEEQAEDAVAVGGRPLTARLLRSMSPGQHAILDLLLENNGICHMERLRQHVQGWREPQVSIKGLQHRGLVTVDMTTGDWGCPAIHFVRLTSQGRLVAEKFRL